MSTIEKAVHHNLEVLGCGRELARLADKFLSDYPDPWQLAMDQAAGILKARTGKGRDPRRVWWHEFKDATSSPRSFNGWAHSGRPHRSLLFPQLMLERFEPYFQDATDELDVYGGFYRQGPNAAWFDERNDVPMLGRDVQKDFWAMDFAHLHRLHVAAFWSQHHEDFRVLAKVNLLAQCAGAERDGRLGAQDAALLRAWIVPGLGAGEAPTLVGLHEATQTRAAVVSTLYLAGTGGACAYLLQIEGGRPLLYLPWAEQALHGFDSEQALAGWLRGRLSTKEGVRRFLREVAVGAQDSASESAMHTALQALADSPDDASTLALLAQGRSVVEKSFFLHLTEQAEAQMHRDAARMVDNSQLRKAMWRGYLGAFLQVFGGFVPLGWPVTLAVLGITVARVGLDIDAAVHARSVRERKAAMRAAMLESIFAALNMIDVGVGSSFASLSYQVPFHELDVVLDDMEVVESAQASLSDLEGNVLLVDTPLTEGRLNGVQLAADGSCWIELEGLPYRVRYSPEHSCWLIVPPENPFAFAPVRPVRLNAQGEWELLAPPRLSGGMVTDELQSEPSQFWDEYMKTNDERQAAMSDAALARQSGLLKDEDIFELDEDRDPLVDDLGFDYANDDGLPVYTYRHDGEYKNHRIFIYTDEEGAKINRFLRMGQREFDFGNEVNYVNKLADDLEELPCNSDVPLYRGGHGGRGTSGEHFRSGRFRVGDVLVNTDLTSFTENPYIIRQFAADTDHDSLSGLAGLFDDTSVVFELPAGSYQHGTPISVFSCQQEEAETLFLPGSYFRIEGLKEVRGVDYRFVHVRLSEVTKPATGPVYDLRSGEPFNKADYAVRLGNQQLADRFFAT